MTDNLKESLSALVDGEASEIEVHRLLRQFESDETLKPSWVSYLQVRSVVRGESVLAAHEHHALHQRISLAIADEESYAQQPEQVISTRRYAVPAAGFAVAASLVLAVMVGINIDDAAVPGEGNAIASQSATMQPNMQPNTQPNSKPIVPTTVSTSPLTPAADTQAVAMAEQSAFETGNESMELKELNEEQQRRLRAYLNQHERMVRNPLERTVIFENPNGN